MPERPSANRRAVGGLPHDACPRGRAPSRAAAGQAGCWTKVQWAARSGADTTTQGLGRERKTMRLLIPIAALLLACAGSTFAVQGKDRARDEEAIRKALDAYVAAYNRGDAKALAALMTTN